MTNLNNLLQGTGVATTEDTTKELLAKFGLDWTVSKQPLNLPSGKSSGFFGIVRDDKETTFATAKAGYEVFQNSELLDLVNRAAGNLGLSVDRGGSFKGGALVFLQLNSGVAKNIGENNDSINKFISGINSHDGSTSLRWGTKADTISCKNSFWRAYRILENRMKHTISMRMRLEEMTKELDLAVQEEKNLYDTFYKFAEVPATKDNIIDTNRIVLGFDIVGANKDSLTTYQINRLKDLSGAITSEMKQKGNTLWGLFSGVTKYTTHLMTGGEQAREQSKAIGSGYRVDNEVFNRFSLVVK